MEAKWQKLIEERRQEKGFVPGIKEKRSYGEDGPVNTGPLNGCRLKEGVTCQLDKDHPQNLLMMEKLKPHVCAG